MGEENKGCSALNLLEKFKHQDNELTKMHQKGLNPDLSLGPSHTTQPPPENRLTIQNFPLNDNNYDSIYRQAINDYNFGQHFGQQVLARAMSVPHEVEAQMKQKEPLKQNVAKKRSYFPEEVNEGRFGNLVVESVSKNPAFCRNMEKLKTAHAPENSNSARTSSPYHPKASSAVNESGESAYNLYGNEGNKLPAKKEKVSSLETPISTLQLMRQMPSVMVVGPTGMKVEGVLFKYNKEETVIVCLCHMYFSTPDGFIGHAGWGRVPDPFEHIKVFILDH